MILQSIRLPLMNMITWRFQINCALSKRRDWNSRYFLTELKSKFPDLFLTYIFVSTRFRISGNSTRASTIRTMIFFLPKCLLRLDFQGKKQQPVQNSKLQHSKHPKCGEGIAQLYWNCPILDVQPSKYMLYACILPGRNCTSNFTHMIRWAFVKYISHCFIGNMVRTNFKHRLFCPVSGGYRC